MVQQTAMWAYWGLSLEPKVYAMQTKEANERMERDHNLVSAYLTAHPKEAVLWGVRGWGYGQVLSLAKKERR